MAAAAANSAVRHIPSAAAAAAASRRHAAVAMYRPCSVSMNGCGGEQTPLAICETRTLPAASTAESAAAQLGSAVAALNSEPPHSGSGIIRVEVPIRQGGEAIEWLQAQRAALLPRCFFSGRAADRQGRRRRRRREDGSTSLPFSENGGSLLRRQRCPAVLSVAGVGSAVHFRRSDPFAFRDWRSIKRFLSADCPLIRAYGAIRFDACTAVSPEWRDYGSFYFVVPQIKTNGRLSLMSWKKAPFLL